MEFFGSCEGKNVIIIDDMVDTGGTLAGAGKQLIELHGAKTVIAVATHGLLNGQAPQVLQESCFEKVFVTDSVHIPEEKKFDKLIVVSLAPMLAQVIHKISKDESIHYENW
jgi:ribose-phosphate pyrophosphokinase